MLALSTTATGPISTSPFLTAPAVVKSGSQVWIELAGDRDAVEAVEAEADRVDVGEAAGVGGPAARRGLGDGVGPAAGEQRAVDHHERHVDAVVAAGVGEGEHDVGGARRPAGRGDVAGVDVGEEVEGRDDVRRRLAVGDRRRRLALEA